jgi:hypothetical protein
VTRLRGVSPQFRIDAPQVERVSGLLGQLFEILRLRPAIPLTEWMDLVDIANDDPSLTGKFACGQTLEKSGAGQPTMNIRHSCWNILTELELIAAFEDFDGADLSGPIVDVLEKVAMDGAQMGQIERAAGNALGNSVGDQTTLNSIKLAGVGNAEAIAKDVGTRNDVWIVSPAHVSPEADARARI